MGFLDKVRNGLKKTKESLIKNIETVVIGYAKLTMTFGRSGDGSSLRRSWRAYHRLSDAADSARCDGRYDQQYE